jgi:thioredoxin 1
MSDAADHAGIDFIKVDVDKHPAIAQENGVRAMPTFMLFTGGEKGETVMGANPKGLQTLVAKAKDASGAAASSS